MMQNLNMQLSPVIQKIAMCSYVCVREHGNKLRWKRFLEKNSKLVEQQFQVQWKL